MRDILVPDLTVKERAEIEAFAKEAQQTRDDASDLDKDEHAQLLGELSDLRMAAAHEWPCELEVRRWLKDEASKYGRKDFSEFELYHHHSARLLFNAFAEEEYVRVVAGFRQAGVFLARGGIEMMRYNYYVLSYMAGAYWQENMKLNQPHLPCSIGGNIGAIMGKEMERMWHGVGEWKA